MNSRMQRAVGESSVSYCKLSNIMLTSVWFLGRAHFWGHLGRFSLPRSGHSLKCVWKNDCSLSVSLFLPLPLGLSPFLSPPTLLTPYSSFVSPPCPPPHRLSPSSLSHHNRINLTARKGRVITEVKLLDLAPEKQKKNFWARSASRDDLDNQETLYSGNSKITKSINICLECSVHIGQKFESNWGWGRGLRRNLAGCGGTFLWSQHQEGRGRDQSGLRREFQASPGLHSEILLHPKTSQRTE